MGLSTIMNELMARMAFGRLLNDWSPRPLKNCPGRYVLPAGARELTPENLLGNEAIVHVFRLKQVRDPAHVAQIEGGGLISYQQVDGSFVHTLCNVEGFGRKLASLGIGLPLPSEDR